MEAELHSAKRALADLALREGGLTDELGALREQLVAAERRAARVASLAFPAARSSGSKKRNRGRIPPISRR
jgi:hypothetical protein